METPNYIKSLLKPNGKKPEARKVWSIDLETVWLPFFMATNTAQDTAIPHDAIGAPLRLAYNADGAVKFSKSGRPVVKVAKPIAENVQMVRENFIAGLQTYARQVITSNPDGYKEQAQLARLAGEPIKTHDAVTLSKALEEAMTSAIDEATATTPEAEPATEPETKPETKKRKSRELVTA